MPAHWVIRDLGHFEQTFGGESGVKWEFPSNAQDNQEPAAPGHSQPTGPTAQYKDQRM